MLDETRTQYPGPAMDPAELRELRGGKKRTSEQLPGGLTYKLDSRGVVITHIQSGKSMETRVGKYAVATFQFTEGNGGTLHFKLQPSFKIGGIGAPGSRTEFNFVQSELDGKIIPGGKKIFLGILDGSHT